MTSRIGAPVATKLPRPRPPATPIAGRHGRVVPTTMAHADALHEAFAADRDSQGWTYLPYGPFATEAAFSDWLYTQIQSDDPMFHTVLDTQDTPLGLASLMRIDPGNGVIEIGHIHLSPAMQRTTLATEAFVLLATRVFDELGYRRFEWKCDALNQPSRRAAQRFGFTYEGTFRQAAVVKGHNRDTAWFSIVDHEWPARKAAYQAWLDPENFDAEGHQIRPLDT